MERSSHRFNRGGVEAITWFPAYCNQHGPYKFLADIVEQIAEVALSPPRQLIGMTVWSLAKLRDRKIGWQHTKTWKESSDPEFWPKYRRIRRLYGKRRSDGIRLCIDEFGPLNLQPRHGQHLALSGHPDRLRSTYHRHGGVRQMYGTIWNGTLSSATSPTKRIGVYSSNSSRWSVATTETAACCISSWTTPASTPRPKFWHMQATHQIRFYWTPTSASWLNRIESHFTALRKFALDNTDYQSHEEQEAAIKTYLSWRNRGRNISIRGWRSFRHRSGIDSRGLRDRINRETHSLEMALAG